MAALSWIFGGKKKEDKPVNPPVHVEAIEVGSDEDYAIIQANTSSSLYPQMPPSSQFYTPLPYSVVPQCQDQNRQPNGSMKARTFVQNQLDGVPFVISPSLEKTVSLNQCNTLEEVRRAVFQIAADINDPMYNYDFKLEHSTIQEATIYNSEN